MIDQQLAIPVFDISEPLSSSSLSSLASACRECGFFQIVNHGISEEMYGQICSLSNKMFNLPSELKLRLGPSSAVRTYTPHFIASPYFESLSVSGPNFENSARSSLDVLFGSDQIISSELSQLLQDYGTKVSKLSNSILKLLLQTLELEENLQRKYFESHFKNCHGYLRINNYSAPPQNPNNKDEERKKDNEEEAEDLGLGMHTDMSCLTILYQDKKGGLQVKSNNKQGQPWLDISPRDGTLVVNVGDMLQAWSNERLRSSEHRVVFHSRGKASNNRFSLAFFWCFEDEKVICSPDEIVGVGNERIYDSFVCRDYVKFRENDERGKFEKVGFTVKDFAGVHLRRRESLFPPPPTAAELEN